MDNHYVTSIPLNYYLILSALLFTIGATGVLIKRNPIQIFMCVELMLNAVNLTFIAFSRYQDNMSGQLMVIFVLAVAAAEVAVGLGIIVSIFRARTNINIDDMDQMRG